MSKNKFFGLSEKKINQIQNEKKGLNYWLSSKYKEINWYLFLIFLFSFLVVLILSVFPLFSVKYQIASSSFDNSIEEKIIEGYYKDIEKEKNIQNINKKEQIDDLNEYIKKEVSGLSGEYGFYIKDLGNGNTFGFNEDNIFTAASLSKLFVAGNFYNRFGFDEKLKTSNLYLMKEDRVNGSEIKENPIGSQYEAKDLIAKMLYSSDNTAMTIMTRELGVKEVQRFIDFIKLENTSFTKNTSTPKDIGLFLEKLEKREFLDSDSASEMIAFMQNTTNEDRLPYYLPEGVRIAHKIGTWDGAYSDAGIVFGENKKYIIVAMTEEANYVEAIEAMRKISLGVYNYFN